MGAGTRLTDILAGRGVGHVVHVVGAVEVDPIPTVWKDHLGLEFLGRFLREPVGSLRLGNEGNHLETIGEGFGLTGCPDVVRRHEVHLGELVGTIGQDLVDGRVPIQTHVLGGGPRTPVGVAQVVVGRFGPGHRGSVERVDMFRQLVGSNDGIGADVGEGKEVHLDGGSRRRCHQEPIEEESKE